MGKSRPSLPSLLKYLIILLCIGLAAVGGLYYHFVIANDPIEPLLETNNIYLVEGRMVKDKEARKIEFAYFEQIPEGVINAFVAMEDSRYFSHAGIDIIGVMRAFFVNFSSNEVVQGGSTITQQLAKNLFLDHDRTVERKLTEIKIALSLENKYGKNEIIEMYLSQIYFGHGNWGIKQAASSYFNKELGNITLAEGALLAGIIQSPNVFAPVNEWALAVKRQKIVLERMLDLKLITAEEFEKAILEASTWK